MAAPEYLLTWDSMLIFMETKKVSLGAGVLIHLDGPVPFDDYVNDFTHRLNLMPRMRQKVVKTPFGLGMPTWEHDHAFDLDNHITRVTLPAPGTEDELHAFVSEKMSIRIDMSRSPWEIFVIDGLADGRGVVLVKIHHCMTDGQGGEKIFATLVDFEKTTPRTEPAELIDMSHATAASGVTRLYNALTIGTGKRISEARRMLTGNPPNPRPKSERARSKALLKDYAKLPGIRFGFNTNISGRTHYGFINFPLDELRAIRSQLGGTVNDVYLTALTGLLNRIAREEGTDATERFCRVPLATNVRDEERKDAWGNHAVLVPTLLPMGIEDPIERLRHITEHTRQVKEANLAQSMLERLTLQTFFLPAPLLRLLAATFTSELFNGLIMRFKKNLPRNLYSSNIRWPEVTGYMGGRQIENFRMLVPVAPATGLVFVAITYGPELRVTLAGDPACIPDMNVYVGYFQEAYDQLRDAAGVGTEMIAR